MRFLLCNGVICAGLLERGKLRKIDNRALLVILALMVGLAINFTKPWDDLQSWRRYTHMVEWTRADLFTHWQVLQPVGKLSASSTV